jgi:cell division protein FtsB
MDETPHRRQWHVSRRLTLSRHGVYGLHRVRRISLYKTGISRVFVGMYFRLNSVARRKCMAKIDAAKQKLEQALARLEGAVSTLAERGAGPDPEALTAEKAQLESELSALKAEHTELAGCLDAAHENYAALEKVIDTVSERLDTTIGRLRTVLEG